jgi:hypothetical protein
MGMSHCRALNNLNMIAMFASARTWNACQIERLNPEVEGGLNVARPTDVSVVHKDDALMLHRRVWSPMLQEGQDISQFSQAI